MESVPELLCMQKHTIFTVAESRVFDAFVCKLAIVPVLAVYSLQSCK